MTVRQLFIEKLVVSGFAVRRPGSERASIICTTKDEAIRRARKMNPDAEIYVERIHNRSVGGRDKWIKAVERRKALDKA